MISPFYTPFFEEMARTSLRPLLPSLEKVLHKAEQDLYKHGRAQEWLTTCAALPCAQVEAIYLNRDAITVTGEHEGSKSALEEAFMSFHPWRKGPFQLFDMEINTEWRSDWKWDRLAPFLPSLKGKTVLDVGCANGYHLWRLLGAGADFALGIDPSIYVNFQFRALHHYIQNHKALVLPLGIENLPPQAKCFDVVFSMGILYHRRSPLDHLLELYETLAPGGTLILETLVIKGEAGHILLPQDRYAQMRNIWFLPSTTELLHWVNRMGFKNVSLLDTNQTSLEEQRSTPWMTFQSLKDFLDPNDHSKTIEGYPAPTRALLKAQK